MKILQKVGSLVRHSGSRNSASILQFQRISDWLDEVPFDARAAVSSNEGSKSLVEFKTMSSRSPPGSVSGTSSYATRKSTITTSQRVYRTQVLKSVGIFIEEAIDEARRQLLYPPEMTGISDEIVDEISNDLVRSSSSLLADSGSSRPVPE